MFNMLQNFSGRLEVKKKMKNNGGGKKRPFFPYQGLYLTIRQDTFELFTIDNTNALKKHSQFLEHFLHLYIGHFLTIFSEIRDSEKNIFSL